MIRLSVIYPRIDNAKFDLDYYMNTHMPLVSKLYGDYGLQDFQVDEGISLSSKVPSDNIIACYMVFDSLDNLKAALKNEGAKVMADVANFTNIEPTVMFGQVYSR